MSAGGFPQGSYGGLSMPASPQISAGAPIPGYGYGGPAYSAGFGGAGYVDVGYAGIGYGLGIGQAGYGGAYGSFPSYGGIPLGTYTPVPIVTGEDLVW